MDAVNSFELEAKKIIYAINDGVKTEIDATYKGPCMDYYDLLSLHIDHVKDMEKQMKENQK